MPSLDELDALLEAVLARAGEPLSVAAVLKAMPAGKKPKRADAQERLAQLAKAGRIHRWRGKAEKFAAVSAQALARDQILQALSSGPLPEAEIKKRLAKSVQTLVKSALAELVAERSVQKHPKLGTRLPFGLGRPNAIDYLPAEIASAFAKLKKIGFDETELKTALRRYADGIQVVPPAAEASNDVILEAMSRLNTQAARGALVYIKDLRVSLTPTFRDKDSFDRAVLDLAAQGKVQLQTHAWPGRLSDDEKNALVSNGRGGFFDAIGIRLE